MHDRLVRRIMKREGDGSFAILLGALSCIYADEGYYVCADELFYEDLSASFYRWIFPRTPVPPASMKRRLPT